MGCWFSAKGLDGGWFSGLIVLCRACLRFHFVSRGRRRGCNCRTDLTSGQGVRIQL